MIKNIFLCILCTYFFAGCFEMGPTYSKLPPGPWRAVLKLDPEKNASEEIRRETRAGTQLEFDEVTEGDLPFNFEVVYTDPDKFYIEIINADERIRLDEIVYLKDRATIKDTLIINFPPYDSYFKVLFEDNILEGYWHVPSRVNYQIHFIAKHGQNHRFTNLKKAPVADLSGKWEVYFGLEDTVPEPAVGEFKQNGNRLTGTFLTETGDYRFLEGTVQANKMYLSCFDGAHMFLFEALIKEDGTLSGVFRSGTHFMTTWSGKRNADFSLRNADSLTFLKSEKFDFSFPDVNGKMVSLNDSVFDGKPKIIQILGTYCPNCVDETKFLTEYLARKKPDLEVIGLAFERHEEADKAKMAIKRFKSKLGISYPLLYAGPSDLAEASKRLPQLNGIISYPTLIFLNRANEVVRIHTGFTGPATSQYEAFVDKFDRTVKQLLEEI
ncbi:MAG: TlpA family protein disulfide reductase [Saprospiraceae bacterium]|nr:TlpA family protein disulfide reductase [Saprospiraceae bacterium]